MPVGHWVATLWTPAVPTPTRPAPRLRPALSEPEDTDFEYRSYCNRAALTAGFSTLTLILALDLPWYTIGTFFGCGSSFDFCLADPLGGPPFYDSNWYLWHSPGGNATIPWLVAELLFIAGIAVLIGATVLFAVMGSGGGRRMKLGLYGAVCTATAGATSSVAPMIVLASLASGGSVWGHDSMNSGTVSNWWGMGLGWYLSLAIAVVLVVSTVATRRELGNGEAFLSGKDPRARHPSSQAP